ncbi:hypothetical protein [Acinetobacter baumannii]|uniref:hypothetical protein n=1 Tax=Acinetobacter baumannii TaxID=470 RepID=UPI000A3592B8|nr:hypothetical protein [Acinetobacter baumannii]OTL53955.1 hypothetical protein B9Y00_05915 [Acinetobacter baumannii]
MSTNISPLNRSRSKKITGGRVRCIVYLTKEEVQEIDKNAEKAGMSRSSIISQNYYLGKKQTSTNEDPNP